MCVIDRGGGRARSGLRRRSYTNAKNHNHDDKNHNRAVASVAILAQDQQLELVCGAAFVLNGLVH